MSENVKVCVRVRPFNKREKERGAKCIIGMQGTSTTIKDPTKPEDEPKVFNFDNSYWSHDGYKEEADGTLAPTNEKYDTQQKVFEDVGNTVLTNAYDGFNTSLFAYGQTGSGKSYSMVGYGPNKGIVPIAFDSMFNKIAANTDDNIKFQVTFSMIEIYMEAVADLLTDGNKKLKVRQNPKEGGFFVDGVLKIPVSSYEEIDAQMNDAMQRRTVAATQMNATSSRAHTVVTMVFSTLITDKDTGKKTTRASEINLVDLAGSERANSTGATGARLKEGAQINLSLSALGNVISALATGKKNVPFRDSVLTKLLKNSLGGNAKTIMIAALSPADINFDETLSTLRYADRAKQIKNKAVVNESATDKLIRNLKEENEKMKAMLEGKMLAGNQTAGMSEDELAKMKKEMEANIRAQIMQNEKASAAMDEDSYAAQLAKVKAEFEAKHADAADKQAKSLNAHRLANINEDPALSGLVIHLLDEGKTTLGRKAKSNPFDPKIKLAGLSINDQHCVLILSNGKATLQIPSDVRLDESKTCVNGKPVAKNTALQHGDRILFGTNHLYMYVDPAPSKERLAALPASGVIDWEFAQGEIMANKGFAIDAEDSLHLGAKTREEVMELLPMVTVANAISERLDKRRAFEIAVLSGPVAGLQRNESKVMIKMRNLDTNNRWMIDHADFIQRHFVMQKLLQKFGDDEDEDDEDDEDDGDGDGEDPFDVEDSHIILGTATCFMQSLCYCIEFEDTLNIIDYKGRSEGKLALSVFPCEADGTLIDTNEVNEDPKDLIGKPLSFKITITGASINKPKYAKGAKVKFSHEFLGGEIETPSETGPERDRTSPKWNFEKVFTIPEVTEASLDWLQNGNIGFYVSVWQSDSNDENGDPKQGTTSEVMQSRRASGLVASINTGAEATALNEAMLANAALESEVAQLRGDLQKKIGGVTAVLDSNTSSDDKLAALVTAVLDGDMSSDEKLAAIRKVVSGSGGAPAPRKPVQKSGTCVIL